MMETINEMCEMKATLQKQSEQLQQQSESIQELKAMVEAKKKHRRPAQNSVLVQCVVRVVGA